MIIIHLFPRLAWDWRVLDAKDKFEQISPQGSKPSPGRRNHPTQTLRRPNIIQDFGIRIENLQISVQ